ncbi:MAG: hypothetical protein ACN6QI_13110, partial [Pseudomonas sp.]|uniref:hypothetical protein n=1 Tax=Pseudomonas sp. TaxID=306 RepID=UPI003D101D63
ANYREICGGVKDLFQLCFSGGVLAISSKLQAASKSRGTALNLKLVACSLQLAACSLQLPSFKATIQSRVDL